MERTVGLVRLRLDPWPGDYEGPFQLEELEESSVGQIDPDVEGTTWGPIQAKRIERPEPLFFVDGVRRIDARVIADDDSGRIVHGLFGSVASGAVRVEGTKAAFDDIRIRRYIVLGSGLMAEPEVMTIGNTELAFAPYSVPDTGPTAPLLGMQNLMRTEEAAIAQDHAREAACVFADGPLTYFAAVKQRTVGVIKRLFKAYLPASHFALVPRLALAERTPIFAIIDGNMTGSRGICGSACPAPWTTMWPASCEWRCGPVWDWKPLWSWLISLPAASRHSPAIPRVIHERHRTLCRWCAGTGTQDIGSGIPLRSAAPSKEYCLRAPVRRKLKHEH